MDADLQGQFPATLAAVFAGQVLPVSYLNMALIVCSSRRPTLGSCPTEKIRMCSPTMVMKSEKKETTSQGSSRPPDNRGRWLSGNYNSWGGGGFICSSAREGGRKGFPCWGNKYSNRLTVTNIKSNFPQLILTWCRRCSRVQKIHHYKRPSFRLMPIRMKFSLNFPGNIWIQTGLNHWINVSNLKSCLRKHLRATQNERTVF